MEIYTVSPDKSVDLGRQGENLARKVRFDISDWTRSFGPGRACLLHQRSGEKAPYPAAVEQTESEVIWTVTNVDTALSGNGRAELQYYVGDALVKSGTWITIVSKAMGDADETPPEAQPGWVDQVLQAGAEAAKAAAAAVHQPIVGSNGNWWTWDLDTGAYADTGIYSGGEAPYIGENGNWFVGETDFGVPATGPQGPQGPAGAPGTVAFDALTDEQVAMLKGEKGDTGERGPMGPRGLPGEQGLPGPVGEDGEDGFSPEIYITQDNGGYLVQITTAAGINSFPVYHGSIGPQGPQGETGPEGPQGEQGPAGPALAVTNTAAVGQTVKITAVDEDGQPAAWEAADMESVDAAYELAATIEITESVSSITQEFGKAYNELYIFFDGVASSASCQIGINKLLSENNWLTTATGYKAARLIHRPGIGIERQDSNHTTYGFWQGANVTRRFNFNEDSDFESVVISTSNPVTATINSGTIKIYGR